MENGTTIIHYSEVQFSEVLYICSCLAHFPPAESQKKPKKIKKNPPRKEFLIFEEMKLSSCNIKKILYFRKWNPALLSPRQKKRIHPEIDSLHFRKWNFLALIIKESYVFSKESFSYISRNGTLHSSAQAQRIKKSNKKNFL